MSYDDGPSIKSPRLEMIDGNDSSCFICMRTVKCRLTDLTDLPGASNSSQKLGVSGKFSAWQKLPGFEPRAGKKVRIPILGCQPPTFGDLFHAAVYRISL